MIFNSPVNLVNVSLEQGAKVRLIVQLLDHNATETIEVYKIIKGFQLLREAECIIKILMAKIDTFSLNFLLSYFLTKRSHLTQMLNRLVGNPINPIPALIFLQLISSHAPMDST